MDLMESELLKVTYKKAKCKICGSPNTELHIDYRHDNKQKRLLLDCVAKCKDCKKIGCAPTDINKFTVIFR